ncbi:reactive intermediate/imine deaminase [Enterobacteriaceae endosymbiont of Macroplea mutica]|uniref:Rid family detoxifying hydrolase n=1 Tax=Enterobacteriaceae endosymbiont of Macroplea mutica TaxID=2675791 RepID=UPI00144939D8|nr:Rid family detoxifying hydrolase [Enterobacteriaceae endosymbiont of Macroplea mutica]QJC31190.1 reactive intermediate/imine deaminase [Enterobacteriaceae endosymbiont of Macroplea mutica]
MCKIINTIQAPLPIGPYAQGIVSNNMIITSGQIPINPQTGMISSDIKEQTVQVLKNIKAIITAAKFTIKDIVKTTIFVKNLDHLKIINIIYANFFLQYVTTYPARTCLEISNLPNNVEIEIEAIAIKQ